MILGIGTDIIRVERITKVIANNERFIHKVFTSHEIAYCSSKASPALSYAVRFAAKEAVMKALTTGWDGVVNWQDIEVSNDDGGCPRLNFYGATKDLIELRKVVKAHLSLSHEKEFAIAFVILEGEE